MNTSLLVKEDLSSYGIIDLKDGLTVETLKSEYPWVLEATIEDATLGLDKNGLVWYNGTWKDGNWGWGTWNDGDFESGTFNGFWGGGNFKGKTLGRVEGGEPGELDWTESKKK